MKISAGKQALALALLVVLEGCASIQPPEPPSLELPKPPSDLKATRKGDKVTLTWTIPARTTDRQSVRYLGPTHICRALASALSECGKPVGEVAAPADFLNNTGQKLPAIYGDTLPQDPRTPFGDASYAVEVLNRAGRSAGLSNVVHVSLAETLPPPPDFSARVTAQGVVLTWTGALLSLPLPNPLQRSYRVYRRAENSQQLVLVGEVEAGTENHLSLTDQSFEWQKTYYYHADTLTVIAQPGKPEVRVEGDDTAERKVFANDVFPPAVPTGLQAVFSGPGQQAFIDLVWSPVTDADLAGYNIYRHEEGSAPAKLNATLVVTPSFRDTNVVAGKTYSYSVSAVDQRGNESAPSEEASERVP
jgi:hypothetical protein